MEQDSIITALTLFRLADFVIRKAEEGTLPPLFLLYMFSNYDQTWYDSTVAQGLSKAVKVKFIITSL